MTRKAVRLALTYTALTLIALVYCSPFVWMVVQSLHTLADYYLRPPTWPIPPEWGNYAVLLTEPTFVRAALNSVIVAVIIATLQVAVSSLAAFAFAVLEFKGRNILFALVISTLMVPATATIIPLFLIVKWMGLINSYPGLIVPFIFTGFGIFLMRQFYLALPSDLRSAAIVDGASSFQVFRLIYFPLSLPGAVTLWVLAFVAYWNSLLWPYIAVTSNELSVLPQRIALLIGNNAGQPNVLMAAAAIAIVPVLIIFAATQRFYVRGFVMSGLK